MYKQANWRKQINDLLFKEAGITSIVDAQTLFINYLNKKEGINLSFDDWLSPINTSFNDWLSRLNQVVDSSMLLHIACRITLDRKDK